jgi:hypothetical protein
MLTLHGSIDRINNTTEPGYGFLLTSFGATYKWFAEAFKIVDLKNTKAPLDELNPNDIAQRERVAEIPAHLARKRPWRSGLEDCRSDFFTIGSAYPSPFSCNTSALLLTANKAETVRTR